MFEFAGDLATSSLLSISGLLSGEIIESHRVVDVEFDKPVDMSIFECEPLAGQSILQATPDRPKVSLETAKSKVPFTLLLPKRGVDGNIPEIHYAERETGKLAGQKVSFMYVGNASNCLMFYLHSRPEPESDEQLEWNEIEFSGRRFEISDPEVEGGMIMLRFCQEGTWVEMISDHSRQDLLAIATSFEPV